MKLARGMEIRVPSQGSWTRSKKMEHCIQPTEIKLMSDSPRAFLFLSAVETDGGTTWLHGRYWSDIAEADQEFWMQDGTGVLDCTDGVSAAVEWFVDHMGEFVMSRRLDMESKADHAAAFRPRDITFVLSPALDTWTNAGPHSSWRRGRELATRLSASIQLAGQQKRVFVEELAENRQLFAPVARSLTRFAAANQVRVDSRGHDTWAPSAPLRALISATSINLKTRNKDSGLRESLHLGVERPPHGPGRARTPVLRGERRRSTYELLATREWSIPKPGTAAFDDMVSEAVTWFTSEMAPFVTSQKRTAPRELG